jgi:redox-sensitive bicupin YhaK (pirin superfamily)
MADLALGAGRTVMLPTQASDNVLIYLYEGELAGEHGVVKPQQLLITGRGELLSLTAGPDEAHMLIFRGRPIGETVVNYGPFVMNTRLQIEEAIADYQAGRLG